MLADPVTNLVFLPAPPHLAADAAAATALASVAAAASPPGAARLGRPRHAAEVS
jgi:hypothetical protein